MFKTLDISAFVYLYSPQYQDLFERPNEFWPERYLLTSDGTKPDLDKDYSIRSTLSFGSGKASVFSALNPLETSDISCRDFALECISPT